MRMNWPWYWSECWFWFLSKAVTTPTMMIIMLLSDLPFLPSFPSLPSTMPGTLLNHPLIQKNPKVPNRQRVDVSEPKTKMAKTGLTRTFTPVEAVKQLHQ